MSEESVRLIILKAFEDAGFRALLLSDLQKAVEGYELNEVEWKNLSELKEDFFDETLEIEERISRGINLN